MPMSIKILLFVIAIILFIIAGVRMRTKKGKSITEIVVRTLTLVVFFSVMFLAGQFLNYDDVIIAMLLTFSVLVFGYDVYYVHKIRILKNMIHSSKREDD